MLKSVFELSYFTRKTSVVKVSFFTISKSRYFLLADCININFDLFKDI